MYRDRLATEIMPEPKDPTQQAKSALPARIGYALFIAATLYFCYFSHLGSLGFVGPDEPRYAWIARSIVETGDWITPRLYDKPWFEKPPLYYWSAALSFKLLGISETAARLPSAVSALLATLALAWLAWRMYGSECALWLLLLLPSTAGMIGFSHAAATDMPFSAMLTIVMVCAAVVLGLVPPTPNFSSTRISSINSSSRPRYPWLALALFGFFLGLAALAKGPVAIVLSGGAVGLWALFTKRWRDALRLLHPAVIASFCLTALPWYFVCARRNPDFLRIFIIEHNFKRFLTPEFQHIQPFWYYAPILLIAVLPWAGMMVWAAFLGAVRTWQTKRCSANSLYFLMWFLFCLVFFTISKSKLPGYILPALPAIVILVAQCRFAPTGEKPRSLALTLLTAALVFAACFTLAELFAPHVSQGNLNFGIAAGLIFGVLSIANLLLASGLSSLAGKRFGRSVAVCCVLPVFLSMAMADHFLASFFRWDPSGRSVSRELQARGIPTEKLAVGGMRRGQRFSLSFYLHQEILEWDGKHPQGEYVLMRSKGCGSLAGPGLRCEEVPFNLEKTGFFLYRLERSSLDGRAGGGEAH